MIKINVAKAKDIAHDLRRANRSVEFKPHDEVIMKQIPGNDYTAAEQARQEIRDKYVTIQNNIEQSSNIEQLTEIVDTLRSFHINK